MKGIMITAWAFTMLLLTACGDKSLFMGRHNVASGDYYLTFSAGNARLLIDDPKILKKYQQELRVQKATRTKTCTNPMQVLVLSFLCAISNYQDDYSLKLMHKKKGLVRELKYGETYNLPEEMGNNVKILGATETWGNTDRFLQRIQYLQQIEGVQLVSADTPPYSHLLNIYFPLRIEPSQLYAKSFDVNFIENTQKKLTGRLAQEMEKLGITDYQVTKLYHQSVHQMDYEKSIDRMVHVIPLASRYTVGIYDRNYVSGITGYQAYLFAMQVNCNKICVEKIKAINPLDWLSSPISHADFMDKIKAIAEGNGKIFNPEFTIKAESWWKLPPDYFLAIEENNKSRNYMTGNIYIGQRNMGLVENLKLSWEYDTQHAFNHSATELAQPILKHLPMSN